MLESFSACWKQPFVLKISTEQAEPLFIGLVELECFENVSSFGQPCNICFGSQFWVLEIQNILETFHKHFAYLKQSCVYKKYFLFEYLSYNFCWNQIQSVMSIEETFPGLRIHMLLGFSLPLAIITFKPVCNTLHDLRC